MQSNLHFPKLYRQSIELYYSQKGQFYARSNYQQNYARVAEDCKHRCVYCDATEKECGGEPFSLDHFRPRASFATKFKGVLIFHPYNLHLSCQKCNVLKSNDWQGCLIDIEGPTHCNGKGYIDRFVQDISDFLEVNRSGRIRAKQPHTNYKSPGNYIIERLRLNRPNRVYLRNKRNVDRLVHDIENLFSNCTDKIIVDSKAGYITPEEGMKRISKLEIIRNKFKSLK